MCEPQNDRLVLIVSTDTSNWLPYEAGLRYAGFRAAFQQSSELSAALLHPPPDALIIDRPLAGTSGLDFYREIRAASGNREIPVILVISPEETNFVTLLSPDEQLDVICSPIDTPMLIHRLRTLLRGSSQQQQCTENAEDWLLMLKEAVDSLPIGITLSDTSGKIVYSNPTEALMHGYSVEELIGREAAGFARPSMRKPFAATYLEKIEVWKRESTNLRRDGSEFPVQLTSITVRSGGRCLGIVTTCEDISERKEAERQIYQLAHMDSLTGLPNRRLFQDRFNQALALARREEGKVCLAYLDLDNFKLINDSQGHDFGDKLLQSVAKRLSAIMRESDTLARLGGDEFVVIMVSVKGQENFSTAAQRMLSVFYHPFHIEGRRVYTSASIGMAIFPDDGLDGELLLKSADTAMYRVKQEGRSGFRFFSADMNEQIIRRVSIESSLHSALANNEFFLLYQPRWNSSTQRITGAEALVRWQSNEFSLMMPVDFVPMLEDSGLIFSIGEWILRTACEQAKLWHDAGMNDLPVSVNISARQLSQPDFLAVVSRIVRDSGVDPASIELEFTESTVMESSEKTGETLQMLKGFGLQLSIDNFGRGYSCLNYLKNFPVDRLKIDRAFIADLSPGSGDAAIVTAILSMAKALKMQVVAEGVETECQKNCLERLGCTEMQGYLLGRPMPATELEKLLKS